MIHALFLISGALGLIYEVLWMRRFTLLFGATAPATAATLSAIFLGFAAGSGCLGRLSARSARPLRAFGLLEMGVGLGALLVEPLLALYRLSYPSLYVRFSQFPAGFLALKVVLAMAAIFIPTFLMGGTLPLLGQAVAGSGGRLGIRAGGLYAINTLGATTGALLVPFVLLPLLGADRALWLAVAGSFCVGAAAFHLGRFPSAAGEARPASVPPAAQRAGEFGFLPLGLLSFLSGALLLSLEALWTRMFALVHENSVHSFAVVLAVFLLGLAAGAWLAKRLLERGHDPRKLLGAAWIAGGILVAASPRLFIRFTSGMAYLAGGSSGRPPGLELLALAGLCMLPATLFAGGGLPLLMELAGERSRARGGPPGPVLGRLLGLNTLGAIAGPLLGTFLLARALGLWWSICLSGIILVLLGELVLGGRSFRPRALGRRLGLYGLLGAAVYLLGPGDLPRVRVEGNLENLVCLREGSHGTVAVLEDQGHRFIKLNNHYLLGGTASAGDERQQGHLPLLLHPSPSRVLFLGLGTGITAGASLLHPVEKVVVLELVPEVVHAAKEHFREANLGVVEDPRVEVVLEDARNYLLGSGEKFDVIVGDLFVPWRPGEASLYSEEQFRAARKALRPGGLFCQWLPLFQLTEEDFATIAATFLDIFPRTTLWRGDFLPDQPALALIGHTDPAPLDPAAVDRRSGDLALRLDRLNPYLAHPAGLWLFLIGPLDPSDPRYSAAPRNRDTRPWIELRAAQGLLTASAERGRFLREPLDAFQETVRAHPLGSSPLSTLDALHLGFRDAGAALWEASSLSARGNRQEGRRKGMEAIATLPPELQAAILGTSVKGKGASPPPGG